MLFFSIVLVYAFLGDGKEGGLCKNCHVYVT